MAWACPVCNQINDDDSLIKCICGTEISADDVNTYSVEEKDNKSKLTISVIKNAFNAFWDERRVLLRTLILFCLLLSGTSLLIESASDSIFSFPNFLAIPLHLAIFTILGVTCHRIILLGHESVPRFGIMSWSSRETRFLGWYLAARFWEAIIMMPARIMQYPGFEQGLLLILGQIVFLLFGAYIFARISILLPATAVDKRHTIQWAWKITEKNGINLMIILGVPGLLYLPFHILTGYNLFVDYIAYFFQYVAIVVGIIAVSLSYKFLTNKGEHNHSVQMNADQR